MFQIYLLCPEITIKELRSFDLEGGYLIDGFPTIGITSVIATESMIQTSKFNLAGIIDSNDFPPISLIKNGKPNFPASIFVNNELRVAAFLSHIALEESFHKSIANKMIEWAKKQKISLIVSSIPVKANTDDAEILAVGSTEGARKKIQESGIKALKHGTIPGIPGILLNEGSLVEQDVIVLLFNSDGMNPDFRSSAKLCMAMSNLIPGASCDITALQKEAEKIEQEIQKDVEESKQFKETMYR